jgi:hypothetical protein
MTLGSRFGRAWSGSPRIGVHLDVRVGTGLVGEERRAALEAECARLVPVGAALCDYGMTATIRAS